MTLQAQMMVDDPTAALKEVQQLASTKAAKLPDEPDLKHKERFDKMYLSQAGLGDPPKTRELPQKTQGKARRSAR